MNAMLSSESCSPRPQDRLWLYGRATVKTESGACVHGTWVVVHEQSQMHVTDQFLEVTCQMVNIGNT